MSSTAFPITHSLEHICRTYYTLKYFLAHNYLKWVFAGTYFGLLAQESPIFKIISKAMKM